MVFAYLQGLLPKNHRYGARSLAAEEVVLEALHAQALAGNMQSGCFADLALIPVLNEKGIKKTAEQTSARLDRAAELKSLDIYRVAEQIRGELKIANPKKELSLYQIYQIAEKTGIFEAFDEHYVEENAKPLL